MGHMKIISFTFRELNIILEHEIQNLKADKINFAKMLTTGRRQKGVALVSESTEEN